MKTVGDHFQFRHPSKPGKVTVPHPKKDIPIGTLTSIERQSGLNLRGRGGVTSPSPQGEHHVLPRNACPQK